MKSNGIYRKTSNIRCTKSQYSNVPRLGLQLSLRNILKPVVKNEDVVGAAPTTIYMSTKVRRILET